MKPGKFIKHKNHRDIGYQIKYIETKEDGTLFIKFKYWNLYGGTRPYNFGLPTQEFYMKPEEVQNWEVVDV